MDDTQVSRTADAAATRKRRSSILKSQRATRTPFTELEFHVATPTDSAKSRRVSFSRRTGVAEFATNEATTTWKNFYEEHNKSLESSGNDSGSRQPLGHIGKRVFDQQFEEVEAVDYMTTLHPAPNISSSLNFDQLASESTVDLKLTAPNNKFELSAFTNQTNLFGEHTVRCEVTDKIDVDFSSIQNIAVRDDLDEIQEDLKRPQYVYQDRQNISEYIEVDLNMTHAVNLESDMSITETVHSPKVQDVSKNKDIQKNNDWVVDKENIAMVNPYVAPRETDNFVINEKPDEVLVFDGKRLTIQSEKAGTKDYHQTLLPNANERAPQRRTIVLNVNDDLPNFGVNASSLIGVHSISDDMQPSQEDKKQATVLYDDDLGNVTKSVPYDDVIKSDKRRTILYENDTGNLSVTHAIPTNIISNMEKKRTIVYDNDDGNISVIQALPANIRDTRKTIMFEEQEGDISVTQALPANIIADKTKRRTILYEDNTGNLSITQAVPNLVITEAKAEKRRTIVYEDDTGNISVTQAIPSNIIIAGNSDRRRTIVFETDTGNISVTQAVPTNLILQENIDRNISIAQMEEKIPEDKRRRTIVYENDTGNLSITQAVHSHVIHDIQAKNSNRIENEHNKRRTIVFDDDAADISMTQAVSVNQVMYAVKQQEDSRNSEENDAKNTDSKRKTIVFENDAADISVTQAVPMNQVIYGVRKQEEFRNIDVSNAKYTDNKRKTIMFDTDDADISMTQAVPVNQVMYDVRKQDETQNIEARNSKNADNIRNTFMYDAVILQENIDRNISIAQMEEKIPEDKRRRTIVYENDTGNLSITQAVPSHVIHEIQAKNSNIIENEPNKRRTIVFDDDAADISMTQAVSVNQVMNAVRKQGILQNTEESYAKHTDNKRKTILFDGDNADISITQAAPGNQVMNAVRKQEETQNIDVSNAKNTDNKRKTILFDADDADISITQAVPANQVMNAVRKQEESQNINNAKNIDDKRTTIMFDADSADISIKKAANEVVDVLKENKAAHKRRTVLFEADEADISVTQGVNVNQLISGNVPNVHDDLEDALNEALHNKNARKSQRIVKFDKDFLDKENDKRKTVVFNDDISVTEAIPANVLEHNSINEDQAKVHAPVVDVSITDINENDQMSEMGSEKSESILINSIIDMNDHKKNSNPIPYNIANIEIDNVVNKYNKEMNKDTKETLKDISQVFVYHTSTTHCPQKVIKKIEQGDSISQEPCDSEKISTSSKLVDVEIISVDIDKDQGLNAQDASNSKIQSEIIEPSQEISNEGMRSTEVMATEAMSQKSKHSVINDLLDMSSASMEVVDDSLILKPSEESTKDMATSKEPCETNSKDSLFYITKEDDNVEPDCIEKNAENEAKQLTEVLNLEMEENPENEAKQLTEELHLEMECKEPKKVENIQNVLEQIKYSLAPPKNRYYEKVLSSNLENKERKSFRTANDTNELLEMLSDLTDKTVVKLDPHLEEEEKVEPLNKGHLALENKSENIEPRKLSFASRRQSIVLSREDLLNNISMASAALKSRLEFDDSELEDTQSNTTATSTQISPKKTVRISRDVVKTLNFDESVTEIGENTPLKKTAFGESTYMQESKCNVIPNYQINISDGLKELMDDLVKPMIDGNPFERIHKRAPSTCSTQIQTNLTTSSQIDMIAGLSSNSESVYDVTIDKISSVDIINDAVNRSVSRAMKTPISVETQKSIECVETQKSVDFESCTSQKSVDFELCMSQKSVDFVPEIHVRSIIPSNEPSPGRVLIFDHNNPLNNVLLAPQTYTEVHSYDPKQSTETICPSERSDSVQISLHEKDNYESERVSTQYNVASMTHAVQQSGDGRDSETASVISDISKPVSLDQSTQKLSEVKDTEVNTVIAMKGNRQLLEASSSLTLVEDSMKSVSFNLDVDSRTTISQDAPLKVIFTVKDDSQIADSDFTSNEEDAMPKKRVYSPTKREKHKHCTLSSLDVTPKQVSKMPRLSNSPGSVEPEKLPSKGHDVKLDKGLKPGTDITVQQLMAEYAVDIDHASLAAHIKDVLRDHNSAKSATSTEPTQSQSDADSSIEMVSSFTSSNNFRSTVVSASSKVSRMDWRSDEMEEPSCQHLSEVESSVNVVAKIDMMHFMGSQDCEWESSIGDTWVFRLLHSRLRLSVRLEHRHDNATRSRVRADTPVKHVTLEIIPHDTKSTVVALCVRFAAETMRYFVNRGCVCAGDVSALVRRCAAAARLAARWARLMAEAQARLAFSLTEDGKLTLKVANIPLRSVWEVSLQLELVLNSARAAPWVRAGSVHVRRVLCAPRPECATPPLPPATTRLPEDWSHAPRTIWKIFKYLKNKTLENEFIGI